MVAIYSVTHAPHAEIVVQKWQREVCEKLNALEQAIEELIPTIEISDEAAAVAISIARKSEVAHRGEYFTLEDILANFPDASADEMIEHLGELAHLGLLRIEAVIGKQVHSVWPTPALYETFDSFVFERRDPRADAGAIARHLGDHHTLDSARFAQEIGWDPRRFNPAFSIVAQMIGPGRISQVIDDRFVSLACFTIPEERAALRRFANNEERRLKRLAHRDQRP